MGIRLDQQEIDDFLTNGHTLIVSTVDKDGYPHSTPVWYLYIDGQIYFRVRKPSLKTKNLLRNPKVCVLVETGDRWVDLKSVMIRGRVEVMDETTFGPKFDDALNV